MLTLYAKQVSNAKVITKLNRITFTNVINSLDLGSVISPKYITSEAIIAYVRAKKNSMNCNIETLYHMYDSRVEAIEFFVSENSNVTDIPLRDLKLKSICSYASSTETAKLSFLQVMTAYKKMTLS